MDEPGDESMDDSRLDEVESPWDDVTKVSYEFLKTGKSTCIIIFRQRESPP